MRGEAVPRMGAPDRLAAVWPALSLARQAWLTKVFAPLFSKSGAFLPLS
jgi:hypothetical protein